MSEQGYDLDRRKDEDQDSAMGERQGNGQKGVMRERGVLQA